MKDTIHIGKFTLQFALWFILYTLCTRVVLSIIGVFIVQMTTSALIVMLMNAVCNILSILISCRLATTSVLNKYTVQTKDISTIVRNIAIIFIALLTISTVASFIDSNKSYDKQIAETLNKTLEAQYKDLEENEKQAKMQEKDKIIQDGRNRLNFYNGILTIISFATYAVVLPLEKKWIHKESEEIEEV